MGKLTKQQQIMVAFGLGILLWLGGFFFYILPPLNKEIEQKIAKKNDLMAQIERAQREKARLPALKAELETLRVTLGEMESQLPREKDLPGIIRVVTREALQENLAFNSIRPLEPESQQYFQVLPFEVALTGSLHNFVRFLAALGQQERIFQFDKVSLTGGGKSPEELLGGLELKINFTLKTYAYAG